MRVSWGCHAKYHRLGGLKQQKITLLTVLETRKCQEGRDPSRGGSSSSGGPSKPWHSLACSCVTPVSASIVTWPSSLCVFSVCYKNTVTGFRAHPHPVWSHLKLLLEYICKDIISNKVTFWDSTLTWIWGWWWGGTLFNPLQLPKVICAQTPILSFKGYTWLLGFWDSISFLYDFASFRKTTVGFQTSVWYFRLSLNVNSSTLLTVWVALRGSSSPVTLVRHGHKN